jgi:flavorubredoxin
MKGLPWTDEIDAERVTIRRRRATPYRGDEMSGSEASLPVARVDEIVDGIYRINTPVPTIPGGFSFNQYLLVDDEPLLFHTGPRQLFPVVRAGIERVLPIERLKWIAFSHVEADEMGALNELLAAAPNARPLCSSVAALVSIADMANRAPRPMTDGETLRLGRTTLRWIDTPHLPHGWECGYLADLTRQALFCGDLFTQPGTGDLPVTQGDILAPSEAFRQVMDYYSHTTRVRPLIDKLSRTEPRTLLCMHGSAWQGDAPALLGALADAWAAPA